MSFLTYPSLRELLASRRGWLFFIALIVVLSACLSWLVWQIQTTDRSAATFRSHLDSIRTLEGRWDKEILSIQLGIAPNYDAVTQISRDMKIRVANLQEIVAGHASLASLKPAVDGYAGAVESKAWLSEQVKASYAMLRNSVSVLPSAISDSYRDPTILAILPGIDKRAADLITETITGMVSYTISPTPLLRDTIRQKIETTRTSMQAAPPALRETVERFLVQIEVVVDERQRGNQLMLQVTDVPTAIAANHIESALSLLENRDAANQTWLWNCALAIAAFIVMSFAAFIVTLRTRFAKLDHDNRVLIQANQDVEEQLMQSAKLSALGQMVAGITHEINTPLAYVKAVFELIKERVLSDFDSKPIDDDDDETREELELLLKDGLHGLEEMATLVRTMKNFSRLDKGHIESFSVEEGIESALLIARPQLKYVADVQREFDGVPSIMGSQSQLRQVILNLIVNAVDAMSSLDRRGTLTVRTRLTSSDTVQIDVADNGPGIPEDILAKIFDPFFTTKPVGEGTGMGLSICYRIVENHGGTITVNSKPGRGTVFTVTLPRQDEKRPVMMNQMNPQAAA